MEFYSFSFGDMQVAQADASSPEIVAMDVRAWHSETRQPRAPIS